MKYYESIAVGLFVVSVLSASYLLGKRIGYEQGFEKGNTDAYAEGHLSGYNAAIEAARSSAATGMQQVNLGGS